LKNVQYENFKNLKKKWKRLKKTPKIMEKGNSSLWGTTKKRYKVGRKK